MPQEDVLLAIGRRKKATAQVRIKPGSGVITVNTKTFEEYFPTEPVRGYILQPFSVTGTIGHYDIKVIVKGGGIIGQAGACRHGIARGLAIIDSDLRSVLKASRMLTRDARVKERKKPGQPGARKRFQFSKR